MSVDYYWWEVQFTYRDSDIPGVDAYTASIEPINPEDAESIDGALCESTHFVESDMFQVVITITNSPIDALKRAIMFLDQKADALWTTEN